MFSFKDEILELDIRLQEIRETYGCWVRRLGAAAAERGVGAAAGRRRRWRAAACGGGGGGRRRQQLLLKLKTENKT